MNFNEGFGSKNTNETAKTFDLGLEEVTPKKSFFKKIGEAFRKVKPVQEAPVPALEMNYPETAAAATSLQEETEQALNEEAAVVERAESSRERSIAALQQEIGLHEVRKQAISDKGAAIIKKLNLFED